MVSLKATDRKRDKLAAQLTWIANKHELSLPEDRRHDRFAPRNPRAEIQLQDGRTLSLPDHRSLPLRRGDRHRRASGPRHPGHARHDARPGRPPFPGRHRDRIRDDPATGSPAPVPLGSAGHTLDASALTERLRGRRRYDRSAKACRAHPISANLQNPQHTARTVGSCGRFATCPSHVPSAPRDRPPPPALAGSGPGACRANRNRMSKILFKFMLVFIL